MSLSSHEFLQLVNRQNQIYLYGRALRERLHTVKECALRGYISGPELKYSLHVIRGFHGDFAAQFQIESFQFPSVFHRSFRVPREVGIQESGGIGCLWIFWTILREGGGFYNREMV